MHTRLLHAYIQEKKSSFVFVGYCWLWYKFLHNVIAQDCISDGLSLRFEVDGGNYYLVVPLKAGRCLIMLDILPPVLD